MITYTLYYDGRKGIICEKCKREHVIECVGDRKYKQMINSAAKSLGWAVSKRHAICPRHE